MSEKEAQLRQLLKPFLHREDSRIDSFLPEDLECYVGFVTAFQVEDEIISYLKKHPHATTQDLYHQIPEGLPPGDDGAYLLDEDD